jgi:hypothetical protein
MIDPAQQPQPEASPLPCSAIVYRALLRKKWVDKNTGRIMAAAFLRRPESTGNDLDGVSVSPAETCSVEDVRNAFNECFGVVSLHVGRVRDMGLDVAPDTLVHANITGLPAPDNDPVEAERLAGLLARQARIVWKTGDPNTT